MNGYMRAAQLTKPGKPLEIRQVPIPEPGYGELLVKIEASGLCHTDLHIRDGIDFPAGSPVPLTLGHEGIGRVVAGGAGTRTAPGTRVGIPWMHDSCDRCRCCRTGRETFCASQAANGFNVHGTHAEYALMTERFAVEIPDALPSLSTAPMMCAGVTAYGAAQLADLEPGKV
jgi:propanol-preferring alcohol dehydrogenase